MTFAWSSVGSIAPTGIIKVPRASKPAAQRGRILARKVAMANNREPRINIGSEMSHIVGKTPRFTSLGIAAKHPQKAGHERRKLASQLRQERGFNERIYPSQGHPEAEQEEANQTQPAGLFYLSGVEPCQA